MSKMFRPVVAGLCAFTTITLFALSAGAQTQEIKPKPPMYSYIANWQVPRANWGDVTSAMAPVKTALDKALSDGTIVGYGNDTNLVHQPDAETHDVWWSSMSLAGVIKALDQIHASADTSNATLNNSKHWDEIFVSRYYNWKSGSYKGGYVHVSVYKFKADAPDDGLDNLAQHLMVPLLEKALSSGTIVEYEIDTMAVHTTAPGIFAVVYVTPTPEGIDTVQGAVMDAIKAHPLGVQAFGSMTDDSSHRDELYKGDGIFK